MKYPLLIIEDPEKKVTVLNLFYKGAVNAYFLTGSFFKKTVVFEAAIFVGQPEDGAEVRCEVSRRVETAVSRYSGPSALRFIVCSARISLHRQKSLSVVFFRANAGVRVSRMY